jgi:hypothetical protein
MKCTVCDYSAAAGDDDYCTDCREAIAGFRHAISGRGDCTFCGSPASKSRVCCGTARLCLGARWRVDEKHEGPFVPLPQREP